MKTALSALILALSLASWSCSRLESLEYEPPIAPETWLASQPSLSFGAGGIDVVLIQPSSTFIVYALGFLTLGVGFRFLAILRRKGGNGRALLFWGASMLVWGVGTLCAGSSYQAFGYMIKGMGRASMSWTSWWEVVYMLLTVASVSLMAMAINASSAGGVWRKALKAWAILSFVAYALFALIGASLPNRFMVSFEAMVLFIIPGMLAFFAVNISRYLKTRQRSELLLLGAWVGMAATMGAYYAYYLAGVGPALWERGIWFSENDILHVGLIGWMFYLGLAVAPAIGDRKA